MEVHPHTCTLHRDIGFVCGTIHILALACYITFLHFAAVQLLLRPFLVYLCVWSLGNETAWHAIVTCWICVGGMSCDSRITFDPCTVTLCWPAYRTWTLRTWQPGLVCMVTVCSSVGTGSSLNWGALFVLWLKLYVYLTHCMCICVYTLTHMQKNATYFMFCLESV